MLRVKSRATSQVTFDADYNVPDVKPDIGRMIQNKGEVEVEEVRLNDGHAFVRGSLNVDLLYVGEEEGRVYSLSAKLPVEETLNLEGIVSGDKMCLKWEIEDLSLHLIHSRKLNIKAVVTFYAVVDELAGIRLPVAVDDETVSVKKKPMKLLSLAVHKKDTLRKKEEMEGYNIDNEVIKYIATNIKSNIRELEGALTKIVALSRLNKCDITLELAEEALKDIISPNAQREVTPDLIIQIVSDHYGLTPLDISSQKRNKEIVYPRQIVMYLCRNMTETPLQTIGRYLGGRDHTTIIHGAEKIAGDIKKDDTLKNTIEILKKKINPQ